MPTKMTHYKLRITHSHPECLINDVDSIHRIISADSPRFARAIEGLGTDHEHIHYYLICDIKEATLRLHLRKIGKGNSVWSLKEMTLDNDDPYAIEYLAYLYKEGMVLTSFPSDIVEQAKLLKEKIQEDIKSNRKVRKEKKTRMALLIEYFDKKKADSEWFCPSSDIPRGVVEFYKANNIMVRKFAMVSEVQTLLLRYEPKYSFDLECLILQDIYPRK